MEICRPQSWLDWPLQNLNFTNGNEYHLCRTVFPIAFIYRCDYPIVTYFRLWHPRNTTDATCGIGAAYFSRASELILVFIGMVLLNLFLSYLCTDVCLMFSDVSKGLVCLLNNNFRLLLRYLRMQFSRSRHRKLDSVLGRLT